MLLFRFFSKCFCAFGFLSFFPLLYTVCLGVLVLTRLPNLSLQTPTNFSYSLGNIVNQRIIPSVCVFFSQNFRFGKLRYILTINKKPIYIHLYIYIYVYSLKITHETISSYNTFVVYSSTIY